SRVAPSLVPAESDILCETCGYTLNGLPPEGRCPECGTPIAQSVASLRRPPIWEERDRKPLDAFIRVTWEVIVHPTRFYRTLATRRETVQAKRFAQFHWWFAATLLGTAASAHGIWYSGLAGFWIYSRSVILLLTPIIILATYLALFAVTELASRLT